MGRRKLETCKNGHPRTPENVYTTGNCRLCRHGMLSKRRVPPEEKAKLLEQRRIEEQEGNKRFDSFKHCARHKGEIRCKHYSSCSDERAYQDKKLSERYVQLGGKCFELADKDKQFELLEGELR